MLPQYFSRRLAFLLISILLLFSGPAVAGPDDGDTLQLEPGRPVEREIAGGQAHSYRILAAAREYLRVSVAHRDAIDLTVTLFGSDGKRIVQANNSPRTQADATVSFVTSTPGDYRLTVRATSEEGAAGSYELRLAERRAALPEDADRVAAQHSLLEGTQLHAEGRAESLRQALTKYAAALRLWRRIKDQRGEAETLLGSGLVAFDLGERQQALEFYNQALPLWRQLGDARREAVTLNRIGATFATTGEPKKSLDYYSQALSLSRAAEDRRLEADTLISIGRLYSTLGEKPKALDHLNQALQLCRAVKNRSGEAQALIGLGSVYGTTGENQKALDYYNQALPLSRATRDRVGEAQTLSSLGVIYGNLGDYVKALEYHNQALPLSRAAGNRQFEANALNNIAIIYSTTGEFQQALDHFGQALTLFRDMKNRRGEAYALSNIGGVYKSLGENQRALAHYSQALPLWRVVGDRIGEAITLNNLGLLYDDLGEKQKALDYHNQSLELSRAASNRRSEANSLNNLALIYHSMGERQKALDYYHQSLQISRAIGNRRGEAFTLNNLGALSGDMGDKQQALDYYQQALSLRRDVRDQAGEAITLAGIARVRRARGELETARAEIEVALNIIESLRTGVASQELRSSFFSSTQDFYKFHIDVLMQLHRENPTAGHAAAALQAAERSRARSLLETLSEIRAGLRQGVDAELLRREQTLQQQLNAQAERLARLHSAQAAATQEAEAKQALEELLTQYRELQTQIRTGSPRYAMLVQPQPLSAAEIQRQVLDDDTLLLEYSLGEERSFAWAVTTETVASFELPKRFEIEAAARRVYELLTARNRRADEETPVERRERIARAAAEYAEAAAALSQMLLGRPLAAQSRPKKRLLIVAEGALLYVPFAALPTPLRNAECGMRNEKPSSKSAIRNPQSAISAPCPLVVSHEIISLPSASVLPVLRQEMTAGRGKTAERGSKRLAVFADPVFERDDPRVRQGTKAASASDAVSTEEVERAALESGIEDFTRLRFSRQEAEGIAALVPAGGAVKWLDFAASRARVRSGELDQYRVLHFATHALINNVHPELSGIVLSLVDEAGRPQDGFLRLHEIYNLKIGAELVVLSACQTALGKEVTGEGLIGLTRGFMYAGAPRVMASLWNVQDRATAEYMRRFYQHLLKDGMRPAAAMRAAQLALRREKGRQSPYYWAAFTLQGEWR